MLQWYIFICVYVCVECCYNVLHRFTCEISLDRDLLFTTYPTVVPALNGTHSPLISSCTDLASKQSGCLIPDPWPLLLSK